VARRVDRRRLALRLRVAQRLDVPPGLRRHRPGAPAARAPGRARRGGALVALTSAGRLITFDSRLSAENDGRPGK
jgi:hypothetical protein